MFAMWSHQYGQVSFYIFDVPQNGSVSESLTHTHPFCSPPHHTNDQFLALDVFVKRHLNLMDMLFECLPRWIHTFSDYVVFPHYNFENDTQCNLASTKLLGGFLC